jgi:ABC-type lipoprotein release transport system permease subunit
VNRPAIPILAVLLALPLAILLTNLAALIPGLRAARLHPATILRTE